MLTRDNIYQLKYSYIPEDLNERLKILKSCKSDKKSLELENLINKSSKIIKKIKIKKFSFTWYSIPVPSKRPRVNLRYGFPQIYVPDAKKNMTEFERFFKSKFPDFKIIDTPMTISISGFAPTPSGFNKLQKILAELKLIKPWGRVFDTDNFYKAAVDQIIGTVIVDDSLIDTIHGYKFYSIKPRIEYTIEYLEKFPNEYKI